MLQVDVAKMEVVDGETPAESSEECGSTGSDSGPEGRSKVTEGRSKRVTRDSGKEPTNLDDTYSAEYYDLEFDHRKADLTPEVGPEDFRFFATTKCKRLLYLRGFVFNLNSSKPKVSYWRCHNRSCCGCAVLKTKPGTEEDIKKVRTTAELVIGKSSNQNLHSHPPYRDFDHMVRFLDDRWFKIQKNVRVGGRFGRFIREDGQPTPPIKTSKKRARPGYLRKDRSTPAVLESASSSEKENQVATDSGDETKALYELVHSLELSHVEPMAGVPRPSWGDSYSPDYYDSTYNERDAPPDTTVTNPDNFRFFATTKCKRLLYLKGFAYHLNSSRPTVSYWRCQTRGCCGCAVLKPKSGLSAETFGDPNSTENWVVTKNFNQNFHSHPPYANFEAMARFFEDRWEKIRKNVKIGGQRYGRFIREGQPVPITKKAKKPDHVTKPLVDPKTYLHIVCEMHHTKKKGKMLFAEGHLYHATKQRGTKIYWRCRNRPCAATVATNRDGDGVYRIIHKGHPHAEPSSPSYAEALKLSGRMANLRRVQKQTGVAMVSLALDDQDILDTDYNTDYFVQDDLDGGDGPEDDNDSDYSMADEGSFANETVNEEIIVVEACLTLGGEKFLQEIVMADDGTKILLFVTRQNLEYLSLASSWTMDSISSEKLPDLFTHLFTVRARVRYGDPLPLAYALMTNSSHEAFRALFIDLQVLATGYKTKLNPVRVVTELDEGVIKACQEVFDETRVMVSHYHYSRAIWDRAHYCQMNHDYVDAEFLKESTKKLKALAFLPENQIKEAWKELKCNLQDDQGQIVNWFEEVFVLGPIIKAIDDVTFHSTATFQPSSWSQEPLLPMGNSRDPLRNLLTDSFKEWHYKWTGLLQGMDGEGVNPLIEVLKKEQEETERVIGQRLACQDRHLLGDALSDVLANRPTRKGVDLVNEVSLLLDMEDPIPSSSFSLEIIQG